MPPGNPFDLRNQAEARVRGEGPPAPESLGPDTLETTQRLLYELQVHKIELELQNEELRRGQLELAASQAHYFDLYEKAPVGYCTLNDLGVILEVNLTLAALLDVPRAGLVQRPLSRFIHAQDRELFIGNLNQLLRTKDPQAFDLRVMKADGTACWAHLTATIAPDTEAADGVRIVLTDITSRKLGEVALRDSEGHYQHLVEDMPVGLLLQGPQSDILSSNQMALELLGLNEDQLLGKSSLDPDWNVIHEDGSPFPGPTHPVPLAIATRQPVRDVVMGVFRPVTGDRIWLDVNAVPQLSEAGDVRLVICTLVDITNRKRAEEEKISLLAQLQQSQKLESLGILAGGVAHDINNVLGAVLSLASAHLISQPVGSPLHRALDTICKATKRGGKMVKTLLGFARQHPAESELLDLNAIFTEQVGFLERTTLAKVQLHLDLEAELRPIRGDASALSHAFMNLFVNAVDAMPQSGTLTLHSRNLADDWVEVVVEDTGTGMPKEVLEKALDPFFTTKEVGKGTGLGLSLVFSTVKAHRGRMALESEPGKGTRVILHVPACERKTPIAPPAVSEKTVTPHGVLKVLLVDDDNLIQISNQMILEVLGHSTVGIAQSGEEALALLEAGLEPDLVILDMNMPGLGGGGTLPRLRSLRPLVPVLLCTGRTDQTALTLASSYPGVTILAKPFDLTEFQRQLEKFGLG